MGRLVMKFGGTSVANIERIRNVARHVKREITPATKFRGGFRDVRQDQRTGGTVPRGVADA